MPSRKKLQGQSRKAKRASALLNACDHLGKGKNWSRDDWDAACKLWNNCTSKCYAYLSEGGVKEYEFVQTSYDEYNQLNDVQKQLFGRLMLGKGTTACLEDAKRRDLTKASYIDELFGPIWLLLMIEVRDKYDGAMNDNWLIGQSTKRNAKHFRTNN
eukprot:scaffold46643_cov50-Cyclotella_meneghiniana.AAC.1